MSGKSQIDIMIIIMIIITIIIIIDYSIKIGYNSQKSPGDRKRLAVTQTPMKNRQLIKKNKPPVSRKNKPPVNKKNKPPVSKKRNKPQVSKNLTRNEMKIDLSQRACACVN